MSAEKIETWQLLGAAVYYAQKFEFLLYGLAAHTTHLPDTEKRFANLTPESFLRGPLEEQRATLGALVRSFGEKLMLQSDELEEYVMRRNELVHNFWRLTETQHPKRIADPNQYILQFIADTERWIEIGSGLLTKLKIAAAEANDRIDELVVTDTDHAHMKSFVDYATRILAKKQKQSPTSQRT